MAPNFGIGSGGGSSRVREQQTSESSYLSSTLDASTSVEDGGQVIWHGLINQLDPGVHAIDAIAPNPSYSDPDSEEPILNIHHQQAIDLDIPVSFLVPAASSSIRSKTLHPNSFQSTASSQRSKKEPALVTASRTGVGIREVSSNTVLSLTGLSISPGKRGFAEKRVLSLGMPQNVQHMARNSGDGKRPQAGRMASIDSARSNMPQSPYVEEYIKPGTPDAEPRSTPIQQEIAGIGRPSSIVRNRQIAEAPRESNAGLPSEKGFPIQIGSELFRLSGASIMSDCQ